MATATTPCSGTRASACSIALTTSHGPGSRRPSQHTAPPRSEITAGSPWGHAAGIERREVGGGERQAMSGVAEQVALDQDLGDRTCLVGIETGMLKQRRREPEQLAHRIGRRQTTAAHLVFPSLGNSASDVPRKFTTGQPGSRGRCGAAALPARRKPGSSGGPADQSGAGMAAESGRPRRGRAVMRKGAMLFVITAFDRPGALELRMQVRSAHLDYLRASRHESKWAGRCSMTKSSRSAAC